MTIYDIVRPRAKLAEKHSTALLGQSRDSWPSMAPLGHVQLTKMQKPLESEKKNQKQKWKKNKQTN